MREEKLNLLEDIYLAFFKNSAENSKESFIMKLLVGLDFKAFLTFKIEADYTSLKREAKAMKANLNGEKYLKLLARDYKYLKSLITKYVNYFPREGEKVIYFEDISLKEVLDRFKIGFLELETYLKTLPLENTQELLGLLERDNDYKKRGGV